MDTLTNMKKKTTTKTTDAKKLKLTKERVKILSNDKLTDVAGGVPCGGSTHPTC